MESTVSAKAPHTQVKAPPKSPSLVEKAKDTVQHGWEAVMSAVKPDDTFDANRGHSNAEQGRAKADEEAAALGESGYP